MGINTFTLFSKKPVSAAILASYRLFFGLLMFISILRFMANGWVDSLYIQPKFFFSYYGFSWIKPLGNYTYVLFVLAAVSSFFIMIGYRYRLAMATFFLSFSYIELMDKTNYLNHYYFISILSFILIFLPLNAGFSLDAKRDPDIRKQFVPSWTLDAIKLLVAMVYFYAGICKLNSDWLLNAMPLKLWLPSKFHLPIIGLWIDREFTAYLFSWLGALYDLSIPFLLLFRKTRAWAFISVIVFHVLTWLLFPIGMFPFVMMFGALVFFSTAWHERLWKFLSKIFKFNFKIFQNKRTYQFPKWAERPVYSLFILFFLWQMILPWRYLLYPGELFWTEEGFRFSWRVMLMEKTGYAQFKVKDSESNSEYLVDNSSFLTPTQEKQMAFQPDFILQYAHYLKEFYQQEKGIRNPQIFVECYVALNGRPSRLYIDPNTDLTHEEESFRQKKWILPFEGPIKGF